MFPIVASQTNLQLPRPNRTKRGWQSYGNLSAKSRILGLNISQPSRPWIYGMVEKLFSGGQTDQPLGLEILWVWGPWKGGGNLKKLVRLLDLLKSTIYISIYIYILYTVHKNHKKLWNRWIFGALRIFPWNKASLTFGFYCPLKDLGLVERHTQGTWSRAADAFIGHWPSIRCAPAHWVVNL